MPLNQNHNKRNEVACVHNVKGFPSETLPAFPYSRPVHVCFLQALSRVHALWLVREGGKKSWERRKKNEIAEEIVSSASSLTSFSPSCLRRFWKEKKRRKNTVKSVSRVPVCFDGKCTSVLRAFLSALLSFQICAGFPTRCLMAGLKRHVFGPPFQCGTGLGLRLLHYSHAVIICLREKYRRLTSVSFIKD